MPQHSFGKARASTDVPWYILNDWVEQFAEVIYHWACVGEIKDHQWCDLSNLGCYSEISWMRAQHLLTKSLNLDCFVVFELANFDNTFP